MLLATDGTGRAVWFVAVERSNLEALQKVWEWAKENLTTEETKYMLLATGKRERTVWHYTSMRDKEDFLQKIWEFVKEVLTT